MQSPFDPIRKATQMLDLRAVRQGPAAERIRPMPTVPVYDETKACTTQLGCGWTGPSWGVWMP